jgi:hypothetical protein
VAGYLEPQGIDPPEPTPHARQFFAHCLPQDQKKRSDLHHHGDTQRSFASALLLPVAERAGKAFTKKHHVIKGITK